MSEGDGSAADGLPPPAPELCEGKRGREAVVSDYIGRLRSHCGATKRGLSEAERRESHLRVLRLAFAGIPGAPSPGLWVVKEEATPRDLRYSHCDVGRGHLYKNLTSAARAVAERVFAAAQELPVLDVDDALEAGTVDDALGGGPRALALVQRLLADAGASTCASALRCRLLTLA